MIIDERSHVKEFSIYWIHTFYSAAYLVETKIVVSVNKTTMYILMTKAKGKNIISVSWQLMSANDRVRFQ